MSEIPNIVVTSPGHKYLGSSLERDQPPLLAVLVGKKIELPKAPARESGDQMVERIRRESREADIVVLLFEKNSGTWKEVSVDKLGTGPYKASEALTSNFFNAVRGCETDEEQAGFLASLGLAIDEQFIGC